MQQFVKKFTLPTAPPQTGLTYTELQLGSRQLLGYESSTESKMKVKFFVNFCSQVVITYTGDASSAKGTAFLLIQYWMANTLSDFS